MIAVDTNILVRYLTNDNPQQVTQAVNILREAKSIFVSKTVLLELEWVLRSVYELSSTVIYKALLQVVGLPNVIVEQEEQVAMALNHYSQGLDFGDALHLASSQHCHQFLTFDSKFHKKASKLGSTQVHLQTGKNRIS